MLNSIKILQDKQEHIVEKIQTFEQNHDIILKDIFTLEKKIDSLLESK